MRDFLTQIEDIKRNPVQLYKTITLDLTAARSEVLFPVSGNYITLIDATDINVNIQVRFNLGSADSITLKKRQGVKIPFYSLFISNPAQAGKSVTLAYGISESPLEFIDQSALVDVATVGSITSPVDVSDRAARVLGNTLQYNPNAIIRSSTRVTTLTLGAILVDSGAVATAGLYRGELVVSGTGALGSNIWGLQHRNAANSATLYDFPVGINYAAVRYPFWARLAASERLRVEVLTGAAFAAALALDIQLVGA